MFGLDFRFLAFILKPKTRERIEIDIEDRKRSSIFAAKQKFKKSMIGADGEEVASR